MAVRSESGEHWCSLTADTAGLAVGFHTHLRQNKREVLNGRGDGTEATRAYG